MMSLTSLIIILPVLYYVFVVVYSIHSTRKLRAEIRENPTQSLSPYQTQMIEPSVYASGKSKLQRTSFVLNIIFSILLIPTPFLYPVTGWFLLLLMPVIAIMEGFMIYSKDIRFAEETTIVQAKETGIRTVNAKRVIRQRIAYWTMLALSGILFVLIIGMLIWEAVSYTALF